MISLKLIKGFLKKEFIQTLRDPRMRIILFVAPIIQLVLFGVAISTEMRNLRLWADVKPNDYVLQHIVQHSLASGWFIPSPYSQNEDPFELLRAGKIDVALVPPPGGLSKALGRGTGDLQVLADASNVLRGQAIEDYIKVISQNVVDQDLKTEEQKSPLNFVQRVLYNPTLETSYFMVPGVICLLLSIVTLVLTSGSIAREKELGTFEMLISAPVSAREIILGKTLPFVILGLCDAPLILAVAVFGFNVPMRGSFLLLMFATLFYVCTLVAIGALISTFAKNQQQATLGGFLFLFPAILLSGLMFPLENMPDYLRWLSYIDPIAHFLSLIRNIMLKGGEIGFVLQHVGALFLMAVVAIGISYKRFHTTLQ